MTARFSSLIAALAILITPLATAAHAQETPSAEPVLIINEVHAAFTDAGFEAGPITNWGWLSPSLSTFVVRDSTTDRELMVLVFPSTTAAGLFQGMLARRAGTSLSDTDLVAGYGPGTVHGNVLMVQSTGSLLARLAQAQTDQDNGIYVAPDVMRELQSPAYTVDIDFQQALNSAATVNL